MNYLIAIALAAEMILFDTLAFGDTFQCEIPGEPIMYSDLPCPRQQAGASTGNTPAAEMAPKSHKVEIGSPSIIKPAELTPSETAQLKRMSTKWREVAVRRLQSQRGKKHSRQQHAERRRVACESAKAGLARLQGRRRSGYKLEVERRLDQQQDELMRQQAEYCR